MHPVYHIDNGKPDKRYTITKEHVGEIKPYFVARFCGEYIGCAPSKSQAALMAQFHSLKRLATNYNLKGY